MLILGSCTRVGTPATFGDGAAVSRQSAHPIEPRCRALTGAVAGMKYSFDVVEEQVSLEISGGEHTRDRLANHAETSGSPMDRHK